MSARIYLDWNATAPLHPAAQAVLCESLAETGNAASVHSFGRRARGRVETAREQVAGLIAADPSELVFTSGGTEANNTVLALPQWRHVLRSAVEHDSVRLARPAATSIPVDRCGIVDLDALAELLADDGRGTLVSVMLANNETGVIQPLAEIAGLVRKAGAALHCDAVQAAGRIDINVGELDVDYLSLSAHKIGGPQGVGALFVRRGAAFAARQLGGGQERGRRAGSENVAGIAGFGAAVAPALAGLADMPRLAALRDRFEHDCLQFSAMAGVHGGEVPRLANTSCISMPGVDAQQQLMAFDLAGIAVSAGAACSSGKVHRSHVLDAMYGADDRHGDAIRVSLGWSTSDEDISRLTAAWCALAGRRNPAIRAAA